MNPALEVIIAAHNPDGNLEKTIASLVSQSDRGFTVVLSDNHSEVGIKYLDAAQKELAAAGIAVKRVKPPVQLKAIEHWNWAFTQTEGAWLKLLLSGEQLKVSYVAKLKQRISEKPQAQLIRCDLELQTEWGVEISAAPFEQSNIGRIEFVNFFPSHIAWLSRSVNFAYERTAWLGMGGFPSYTPACSMLNLNVILALHYGIGNLHEALVIAEFKNSLCLNGFTPHQVNFTLELWLVLRQAKNYCLANKLPWSSRWLFLRAVLAALKRW